MAIDAKPEFSQADGKLQLKYGVGLDLNDDGAKSISASLVLEVDEKEAAKEVVAKVLGSANLPEWLKGLLGVK